MGAALALLAPILIFNLIVRLYSEAAVSPMFRSLYPSDHRRQMQY